MEEDLCHALYPIYHTPRVLINDPRRPLVFTTNIMAPKIFDKFLTKRERERRELQKCNPSPWRAIGSPHAPGVSDSTCEVNGDPFNGWKLPIPENKSVIRCARQRNPQQQSKFFELPVEVRRMIYIELMGNRRVHIEYSWMWASPFEPKPFQSKPLQPTFLQQRRFLSILNGTLRYWNWHHSVCQQTSSFAEDAYMDRCDDRSEESWKNRHEGLTSTRPGTKLGGAEWLRCCQVG